MPKKLPSFLLTVIGRRRSKIYPKRPMIPIRPATHAKTRVVSTSLGRKGFLTSSVVAGMFAPLASNRPEVSWIIRPIGILFYFKD